MTITDLKPELIWGIFHEITQVPRPSKKEEKIREYLLDFAKKHGIEAKTDAIGNVAMRVPATPGKENIPTVVMQSHMDMVPNQTKPETHNFETDPIMTEVDGEWHHIYELNFGCIGNNSVRVEYKLNGEQKFTQFEFNVLEELSETIEAHSDFMVNETQDNDPDSPTYGIYSDWYLSSGKDATQQTHWGDDWSPRYGEAFNRFRSAKRHYTETHSEKDQGVKRRKIIVISSGSDSDSS